jgi:Zn-dependent M28 family amino/carboxypeptidase
MHVFTAALMLVVPILAQAGAASTGKSTTDQAAPFTAARFREHVAFLASDDLQGRKAGSAGAAKAAEYVAARFKAAGLAPAGDDGTYFQAFSLSEGTKCRNVLGILPGKGLLADQHVIVCAHLDHMGMRKLERGDSGDAIYNGADDNASGVAALVLIAEDLARNRVGSADAPRRAIVFASFDAEELGLIGASRFAEDTPLRLEKTAVVLNFDMIGRLTRGRLFASDAETSADLARAIRDSAKDLGIPVETRLGGSYRGDQSVFLMRKIPAVHFYTGLHADYHEVSDELATLDCEGGARIAALGSRVARFAASHPGRFEYRRINPSFDTRRALLIARRIGVIPAQNAQAGRYPKVLFVFPGSLAARNGIKPGDEFMGINGVTFERLEDAILAAAGLRFDQDQRIAVLRGGKTLDFRIPAQEFAGLEGPTPKALSGGRFEVNFRFTPPAGTEEVHLSGNFGELKGHDRKKMEGPGPGGQYTIRLVLSGGEYQYNFQCRGREKAGSYPDPDNLQLDEFGNSILILRETPAPDDRRP